MIAALDVVVALLRKRGLSADPAALDALMRGIAAAPESLSGPEWTELVDPAADAELTKALSVWRAELAAADDGLQASPAPPARLADLRAELKQRGLDGFVVPRADEHQGEYVPRRSQRLGWLTGFSGSAGLAIVLADRAAIFIDGRYTLAVRDQVDLAAFAPHQIPEQSTEQWIAENLPKGGKLGFDPWLQTVDGYDRFARACLRAGGSFVPVESNPVDSVWHGRPPAPLAPVLPHPVEFAGEASESKRTRIASILVAKNADVALITAPDPIALPKACKNAVELEGIRSAHRRDGAAVSRFLGWLDHKSSAGSLREMEVSDRLQALREETGKLRDLSFDTISGAGANGAIVHYRASAATERTLEPGSLYLVDSGGQYRDGTTDITRTIATGTPSPEMRDRFTRVLKGHIALASARFPVGTTGSQLDVLARYALWQVGLDYDHGTGHGVGAYLSVHEGPHRISKMPNSVALQPGMIVSNEPGYYKTGAYGIRIENLVAVKEIEIEGADRRYLEFETLTLAPIDLACVETGLLTEAERQWLNNYHRRVRETVGPNVDEATRTWLAEATRPI